jgi:transposase
MRPGNRQGRPNYPVEFKRRLAAAACEAGVSKLSMANGVIANMVFKWRREYRAGLFDNMPAPSTTLLPVVIADTPLMVAPAVTAQAASPATNLSAVEIIFADAIVRVHEGVDAWLGPEVSGRQDGADATLTLGQHASGLD